MSAENLITKLSKAWAPPPKLSVSGWADAYRYLSIARLTGRRLHVSKPRASQMIQKGMAAESVPG